MFLDDLRQIFLRKKYLQRRMISSAISDSFLCYRLNLILQGHTTAPIRVGFPVPKGIDVRSDVFSRAGCPCL